MAKKYNISRLKVQQVKVHPLPTAYKLHTYVKCHSALTNCSLFTWHTNMCPWAVTYQKWGNLLSLKFVNLHYCTLTVDHERNSCLLPYLGRMKGCWPDVQVMRSSGLFNVYEILYWRWSVAVFVLETSGWSLEVVMDQTCLSSVHLDLDQSGLNEKVNCITCMYFKV